PPRCVEAYAWGAATPAPWLHCLPELAKKLRPAIHESGVKLNKLCARREFFPQWCTAQTTFLVELGRDRGMIQRCIRSDDPRDSVFFTGRKDRFQFDRRQIR